MLLKNMAKCQSLNLPDRTSCPLNLCAEPGKCLAGNRLGRIWLERTNWPLFPGGGDGLEAGRLQGGKRGRGAPDVKLCLKSPKAHS